ncbi:hypothetical protein PInf_009239 [Phytophthora infestans]|nr:hypothetical protein PInf_009239 [Phytophthora infestans]
MIVDYKIIGLISDAPSSNRTAYEKKQVRCTVLSPGCNQGMGSDAPSSLQTLVCPMPVTWSAEPGWDTAWTVASNAAKLSLSKTPRLAASNAAG